jgi:uncharacterized DUF497 family protein
MRDDVFEWDDDKADYNYDVHGVTFADACKDFSDPFAYTEADPFPHEDRDDTIGAGPDGLLFVVSTVRGPRIRIISARRATKREQNLYHRAASSR